MPARLQFNTPLRYAIRSTASVCLSFAQVLLHRSIHGRLRPGWNFGFEFGTRVLRRHLAIAFAMRDAAKARRYLDSVVINSPELSQVKVRASSVEQVRGRWFTPKNADPQLTVLYFHGGGYSFFPKSYSNLIAAVTLSANSKTLALDYGLSPEHRFPSQLQDAVRAYRWLLDTGTDPANLVLAGDSAGGNLALATLLSARDAQLPLPALVIALSPATDFMTPTELGGRASIIANAEFDWITQEMLIGWADWFCDPDQRADPFVSPIYGDLRGLPPIYIQAGRAEILFDSIQAFADRAKAQGADVLLESWDDMNHDFQMLGHLAPQPMDALRRIRSVIQERVVLKQTPAI